MSKLKRCIEDITFSCSPGCRVEDGHDHQLSCRGCDASQGILRFILSRVKVSVRDGTAEESKETIGFVAWDPKGNSVPFGTRLS